MKNQTITACFTGHRPQKLPFGTDESAIGCQKLKKRLTQEIERLITEQGVTHFISGFALGTDIYCAEIVLKLKGKYPNIKLESAVPCETQAIKWRAADRERYYELLSKCDEETLLQTSYTPGCMQRRNRYMVDKSQFVLAVWDGTPSGTGNTVRYAKEQGKKLLLIDPKAIL